MEAVPAAEALDGHKDRFDLGVFVGDLALDEELTSDDESLEGLQQELDDCKNDQEVANILANGIKLREYTKGVENNIRQVELDSIQDYIKESENLVLLHDQIRDCDNILSQMETVLTGFQVIADPHLLWQFYLAYPLTCWITKSSCTQHVIKLSTCELCFIVASTSSTSIHFLGMQGVLYC